MRRETQYGVEELKSGPAPPLLHTAALNNTSRNRDRTGGGGSKRDSDRLFRLFSLREMGETDQGRKLHLPPNFQQGCCLTRFLEPCLTLISFFLAGKRVEGDDKYKGLAVETFGMSMSAQSYTLREGSAYREALHQMGDAHQAIGAAQAELVMSDLGQSGLIVMFQGGTITC